MTRYPRTTCPHCGNRDAATIEHNGCPPRALALTFLCVVPCAPEDSSFDDLLPEDSRRICGMQWAPNAKATHE